MSGIWQGLVIKNGHQKDTTFCDEIILCAQNKTPCPMFNSGYNWESSHDHSKNNFFFCGLGFLTFLLFYSD